MSRRNLGLLLVIVLMLNWADINFQQTAYASPIFQGSITDQCRNYTQEASEDSLQELNEHQKLYLNFRTRQIAENVPPQLVDRTQLIISDYQTAIALTEQAIAGKMSQNEWRSSLAELRLLPPCNATTTQISKSDSSRNRILGGLIMITILGIIVSIVIYRIRLSRHKLSL